MRYPRTSGIPLSDTRVGRFRDEAKNAFERSCNARLVVNRVASQSEGDFRKIGINHIVDRIWFVDRVFGDTAFGTPSGTQYGIAVAEGESRLALDKLFALARTEMKDYVTEVTRDAEEQVVHLLLDNLERRGFEPTAILSSVYQSARFWDFKSFVQSRQVRRGLMFPEGTFRGVPVFYSRLLPDGVILSVDKEELGTLEVKADFDISVSEIEDEQDRESIRKALPDLGEAELDEKVRVLCYEIVKATILEKEPSAAFQMLASKGTELELKIYK